MIVTTMDAIAGHVTEQTLGIVRGTSLWTRRVTKSCIGGIRQYEVNSLKDLDMGLTLAKEEATKLLVADARKMGADAVVAVRTDVVEMSNGAFCVNASGTAVKTIRMPQSVPVFSAAPEADDDDFDFSPAFLAARPSYAGSTLHH